MTLIRFLVVGMMLPAQAIRDYNGGEMGIVRCQEPTNPQMVTNEEGGRVDEPGEYGGRDLCREVYVRPVDFALMVI